MIINIFILISFISFISVLHADMKDFYKVAKKNLAYDKTFDLYKSSRELSQKSIVYNQYANFSLDASYMDTKAQYLQKPFDTVDVSFSDNIDIFNKQNYQIKSLSLDTEAQKSVLDVKKEQLFDMLVTMISLYHSSDEKHQLNKKLYTEQLLIYKKLHLLQLHGVISSLDLLRFKNTLSSLQVKIINQKNSLLKIKNQLNIYAPNQPIPLLESTSKYSKQAFLSQNPQAKIDEIMAKKSISQAQGLEMSYLPELSAGLAYQKITDPTSYGNNYSLSLSLHIPLNSGNLKKSEALKVDAMSKKSRSIEYKLRREKEYVNIYQNYINATEQLNILDKNLLDYKKSKETMKVAFLKQFVDFNSYLQVLREVLAIQEKIIDLKYQVQKNATILNYISSGVIYE